MRRLLSVVLFSLSLGALASACQNECPDEGCRCDGYCRSCPCETSMGLVEEDAGEE